MSTVVIRHYLYGPDQTGVPRVRNTVTLHGAGLWLTNETGEIVEQAVEDSDDTGLVDVEVTPNSEIAGPDSYYVWRIAGTTVARAFVAPVSATPVKLVDCLVDPDTLDPVDPELPSLYLARTELGAANGVAPLDGTGKVPAANLPSGSGGELDADLVAIAALTPSNNDVIQRKAGVWTNRTPAQLKTDLAIATGDVDGFSAAVVALVNAGIAALVDGAPGALDTLNELAAALGDNADYAATITTALAGKQPLDSDLSTIAGLTPTANDLLQYISGAWANRTPAQVKTSLALVKADVGLSAVDNTADTAKPVSTAQNTAIGNRGVQATASSGLQVVAFTGDTSGAWALCPAEYRVAIAAAPGDVLLWQPQLLVQVGGDAELDVASVIGGTATRFFSSGTTVQAPNGHGGLYVGVGYNSALKPIRWIVTADDLDGGNVTLALMRRTGSGVTFGSALYPNQVDVTNLGAVA